MKYELHSLCALWPQMKDAEIDKLAADIQANGQQCPIVLLDNKVLDGRNRMLACEKAGVEPTMTIYEGDDPVGFVISKNLLRRHLTVGQRSMMAAELANMELGDNQHRRGSANLPTLPQNRAANLLAVSPRSVREAMSVLKSGDKEAIEAVKAGKIAVSKADKTEREKRQTKAPRKPKVSKPNPFFMEQLKAGAYVHLTPEQVDPEFTGTPVEFIDKYGHVQAMTAEQYATIRFTAWSGNMRSLVKTAKPFDWPNVDHNWLRSPKARDIARLEEALEYLRPKITEAEALLARAKALAQPVGELLPSE
jgi:hypothetical protein